MPDYQFSQVIFARHICPHPAGDLDSEVTRWPLALPASYGEVTLRPVACLNLAEVAGQLSLAP
jgi:hypothetical protein